MLVGEMHGVRRTRSAVLRGRRMPNRRVQRGHLSGVWCADRAMLPGWKMPRRTGLQRRYLSDVRRNGSAVLRRRFVQLVDERVLVLEPGNDVPGVRWTRATVLLQRRMQLGWLLRRQSVCRERYGVRKRRD